MAAVHVLLRTPDGGWLTQGIALVSTPVLMLTHVNPFLLRVCEAEVSSGCTVLR